MDLHFILTAQSGNKLNFQIQLLKYVISRHHSWNKLCFQETAPDEFVQFTLFQEPALELNVVSSASA